MEKLSKHFRTLLAIMLLVAFSTVVFAADPTADAYIREANSTNFGSTDPTNLFAVSVASLGSCVPDSFVYLKFSLTSVNAEIGSSSSIVLTTNSTLGTTGNLVLYPVTDDSWAEGTINGTNEPARGSSLATVSIASSTTTATFTGASLATYLNEESAFVGGGDPTAGDNNASFAIGVEGCGAGTGAQGLRFNSKESAGTKPALNLFNPTAVKLSTLGAEETGPPFPISTAAVIAGLIFLTGAIYFGRRKDIVRDHH